MARLLDLAEGEYLLVPQDRVEQVKAFVAKKKLEEQKPDDEGNTFEKYVDVTLKFWYRSRTVKQNNLQWELCERIGAHDGMSKEQIHLAVRLAVYEREEVMGELVPKEGKEMSTVEYAKVINFLIDQACERGIDIKDIWILFTQWRFQQKKDPMEGTYADDRDYREKHPLCEACGEYLIRIDRNIGELAHIRSVGSGGEQVTGAHDDWDWLMLCTDCHRHVAHQKGWSEIIRRSPWIEPKIRRALRRGA